MMKYVRTLWTSKLIVEYDDPKSVIKDSIDKFVTDLGIYLEKILSKFDQESEVTKYNCDITNDLFQKLFRFEHHADMIRFANYNGDAKLDFTGLMKGLFNQLLGNYLTESGCNKYLISFGGDIIGHNVIASVLIDESSTVINRSGDFCICTSGNNEVRGRHIVLTDNTTDRENIRSCTVIRNDLNCMLCDMRATQLYSNPSNMNMLDEAYYITFDGKLRVLNKSVYIASPFFNKKECRIRDKMQTSFNIVFRPDHTESSRSYSISPGEELAKQIYEDNINEIKSSDYLCFPLFTDDLGTMFEVGVALRINHPIISYNYKTDSYIINDMNNTSLNYIKVNSDDIIDCSKISGAVLVGYHYDEDIKYSIGDLNDNIMLSVKFHRYENKDGSYVSVASKQTEIR